MTNIRRFSVLLIAVLVLTATLIRVSAIYAEDEADMEDVCNEGMFNGQLACVTDGKLHLCINNFPDQAFREYVSRYAKNGFLDVADINAVTEVDLSYSPPITALGGIEFFAGLESLKCTYHSLEFLDLSANRQLTYLDCSHTQLKQLDLGESPRLTTLVCNKNYLTVLNLSQCNALEFLDCSNNLLESLTLDTHPKLKSLTCYANSFRTLDLRDCTALSYLDCTANPITLPYDPEKQNIDVKYRGTYRPDLNISGKGDQFDISSVIGKENIGNVIRINVFTSASATNASDSLPYDPATGMVTIADYQNRHGTHCTGEYVFFDSERNRFYLQTFVFRIACSHEWVSNCRNRPKCTHCGTVDYNSGFGPHIWQNPTADQPKTCTVCGKTEGHPLEHVWGPATCTSAAKCLYCSRFRGTQLPHDWKAATETQPKTCSQCGREDGHPLEHVWQEATCSFPEKCRYCTETRGNVVGHSWTEATCVRKAACTVCGITGKLGSHVFPPAESCTSPTNCIYCKRPAPDSQRGHQMLPATFLKPSSCANCSYHTGDSLLNQFLLPIVAVTDLTYLILIACWIQAYPDILPASEHPQKSHKKA